MPTGGVIGAGDEEWVTRPLPGRPNGVKFGVRPAQDVGDIFTVNSAKGRDYHYPLSYVRSLGNQLRAIHTNELSLNTTNGKLVARMRDVDRRSS